MIIYKITNKINGKVYIGQTTKTLQERKRGHLQAANDGVNHHLYAAIRKYGPDNFEFEQLCEASSVSELNYLEAKYILEYDSVRTGYNMGYGGDNNVMFSPVVKEKHDAVMRSADVRQKISQSMIQYRKENPFTKEHREKISDKLKGNKHFEGHHLTEEHKQILKSSHYKQVYCEGADGNFIKHFDTVQQAAQWWYNNGYNTVKDWHQLCNSIKRSSKKNIVIRGLRWFYVEGGDAQ